MQIYFNFVKLSLLSVTGLQCINIREKHQNSPKKKKSILHYFRLVTVSENDLIRDLSTVLDPSFFTDFLTSVQCICGPVYYPPMFTDFLTSVSIFAGLTILWNLVLMVTWVPAWIVLHHKVTTKNIIITHQDIIKCFYQHHHHYLDFTIQPVIMR